jgi:hypothetical protein
MWGSSRGEYAGQAMLGPQVRLGDLADAVLYFGAPQ